jgi:hypothetical protein
MSSAKVLCKRCGVDIQTWTAARTGGLCMPCNEGYRLVPEDFQEVRRRWSRSIVASRDGRPRRFAERYDAGHREAVWKELHKLDLRKPTSQDVFDDAVTCVRLTMRRVRANVEILTEGLAAQGYAFLKPAEAHIPPTPSDLATLTMLEDQYGPLPLTLRLFYEEVGSVDFCQDTDQMVHGPEESETSASSLETLGEYDPLYVTPVAELARDAESELPRLSRELLDTPGSARLKCWLAPDECHKANYSGAEDYHVYLPEPAVDFALVGAWVESPESTLMKAKEYLWPDVFGPSEFFISHLRRCFSNAGFRGRTDPDDQGSGRRLAPQWAPLHPLVARLLPV